MTYKLEYITRLFQKASSKAIEHYCLSRLWHQLNNEDIKFIPQQKVTRNEKKYALTDLYLPQLKMHIEINEPPHYASPERIRADKKRRKQIEDNTGHKVYEIDCRKDLKEIHADIDKLVGLIQKQIAIQHQNGTFKPWRPDEDSNPILLRRKGFISTADEVSLNSIEDICQLFGADFNKTKRGFLRRGGILHPQDKNILIWWPSDRTRQGWLNSVCKGGKEIIETHSDGKKKHEHYIKYLNSSQKRIVFFHCTDVLGLTSYKYHGIYAYDQKKSAPDIGSVWRKVGDHFNIIVDEKK
ncbi:MAG: hypothetical protein FJX80_11395 [Bacteroidetes bacterium]|nr:hypothetical protein [Bacteroidota bacterium]